MKIIDRFFNFFLFLIPLNYIIFAQEGAHAGAKPNIILIFADDLGWKDVGYNGNGYFETPTIDQLAQEGIKFSSAYAAAGNCEPSRACLLSGNYTPRHEVYAVIFRKALRETKRAPTEDPKGVYTLTKKACEFMEKRGSIKVQTTSAPVMIR